MKEIDEMDEWLESRPECIKELYRRFPLGTRFDINGVIHHLVGYQETDGEPGLLISTVDPYDDYDEAVRTKFFICADHL